MEQLHLLHTFLLHRAEILLVGGTQRGKDADGGLDDVGKRCHLIGLADACLEESHLRVFVEEPDREGDTNLGVVALRGTGNRHRRGKQLVEPLLDHGLAIRTRNADNRDVKLVAVTLSEALESSEGRRNHEEVSIGIRTRRRSGGSSGDGPRS